MTRQPASGHPPGTCGRSCVALRGHCGLGSKGTLLASLEAEGLAELGVSSPLAPGVTSCARDDVCCIVIAGGGFDSRDGLLQGQLRA